MSSTNLSSDRAKAAPASRLILVEDDENVRRSMTMLLRARGFRIDAFRNGTELLMMNGQHGGDCLLIDYKMPRIDGLELMRRTREINDRTPAIMITGFYSDSLQERALQVGYSRVVEKPSTPAILEDTIRQMLS
ncbi:MAG: response regulator [Henriciella sp.]|nr:response regulator [Henriciella sp.]